MSKGRLTKKDLSPQLEQEITSTAVQAQNLGTKTEELATQLAHIMLDVKTFGAKGDGIVDDYNAIINALNHAKSLGGATVYFPKGTYLINQSIPLYSNIFYKGDKAKIIDGNLLGSKPIFLEDAQLKENIRIEGFTFSNGIAKTTTFTSGKNVLRISNVKNLFIQDCYFTEVEGGHCIYLSQAENVHITNNRFYRWTYSAIFLGAECESVYIQENTLDTPTTTSSETHAYCICTGSDKANAGEFLVKNVFIQRNKILNNPKWEAIDTHGGENIWITDNYIYNCLVGIAAGITQSSYTINENLKNVYIKDNILKNPTLYGNYGIILKGKTVGNPAIGEISGNYIENFGSTTVNTWSPIVIAQTLNCTVKNNKIKNYGKAGITINLECYNTTIEDNLIEDSSVLGGDWTNAGIILGSAWIWNLLLKNNTIKNASYGISFYDTRIGGIQVDNNYSVGTQGLYTRLLGVPIDKDTIPATISNSLILKKGDSVKNSNGVVTHIAKTPDTGFGSTFTGDVGTVSGIQGNDFVNFQSFVSPKTYRDFPTGMNVIIVGAGEGGSDLVAQVITYTETALILSKPIATAISNASIRYQGLTLSRIGEGTSQTLDGNIQAITSNGMYYAGVNSADKPTSANGFVVAQVLNNNFKTFDFTIATTGELYKATLSNGVWSGWKKITLG